MLTHLRQIALHPGLVPPNYLEELRSSQDNEPQHGQSQQPVTAEEKFRLQSLLSQAIEDCEECPICLNVLDDARITSCSHMFCVAWYVKSFVLRGRYLISSKYHGSHFPGPAMPHGEHDVLISLLLC